MRRRRPRPTTIWLAVVTAVSALLAGAPPAAAGRGNCWRPPVTAPMVEAFDPPACPWCAGHRGLEYAPTRGLAVQAVAAGTVAFAGEVAHRRYVAVVHDDGRRVTYGWMATVRVAVGDRLDAGERVGTAGARTMFTVREHGEYVDPAPFVGRLVRRPWLVPRHGPGRAAPPAALRCAG